MSVLNTPYLFITFLLAVATITLSIFLLTIHVPIGTKMKRYNTARYILASAYAIIGLSNCYKTFVSSVYIDLDLIRTFTLISASYQALLFTFTLLILIQPAYVTFRRVSIQIYVISMVSVILLAFFYSISGIPYVYLYYAVSVLYVFQLIYYTHLFRNKYNQSSKQFEHYYNDDEGNRLRWVKVYFYMALSIGISALFCTYIPLFYCNFFIPVIIIFYILFSIKFCSYPAKFGYVVAAVTSNNESVYNTVPELLSESENEDTLSVQPWSVKEQDLQQSITEWVKEKKFRYDDISRDDIAESLGTDRYFLASFFQNRMQTEFRVWRTQLRIEEAKFLLLEYPDLSVSKIGQAVGISDRSNFQKKFVELVGLSPKDWREQNLKK